jgi:hypothetical protein
MQNKFVHRRSFLAFLAIMTVGAVAGLWWPAPASPGGGGFVAAAPRNFVPHQMPQQLITRANEDARRYQAVPIPGRSAAMGRVLDAVPEGAVALSIGGATYYMAGGVYYRPVYQGNKVVYQVVPNPG